MSEHVYVTFTWAERSVVIKLAAHLDPNTVSVADPSVLDDTIKAISQLTEIELTMKLPDILKRLIVP